MEKNTPKNKPKDKQYYLVEIEAWAKTNLKYRIFAESPEQALETANHSALLEAPKPKLSSIKKLAAKVYLFGTNMLQLTKKF